MFNRRDFRNGVLATLAAVILCCGAPPACRAEEPATQPAASAPSPEVSDWLDRIEKKSSQTKSLQADVRYDRNQGLVGDKQRRFGKLTYVVGPPAKYAVHFERLVVDERVDKQDRWYIFDGQWLVERLDDEKQFIKRQIVAPGPPEQADPLRAGEGPFPLPITMDKARTLKRFDVTLAEPAKDDPANSVHLKLTPRANTKSDYVEVHLWYDRDALAPVRVRTLSEDESETVIQLTRPRVNEEIDAKVFNTSEPKEKGWHVEVKPWE